MLTETRKLTDKTAKGKQQAKVIDMKEWLKEKRDQMATNVLIFTRRGFTGNDHPPTVA